MDKCVLCDKSVKIVEALYVPVFQGTLGSVLMPVHSGCLEKADSPKKGMVNFKEGLGGVWVNQNQCPTCNAPIPNPVYDGMVERLMSGDLFDRMLEVVLERVLQGIITGYLREWANDSLKPDLIKGVEAEKESLIDAALSRITG